MEVGRPSRDRGDDRGRTPGPRRVTPGLSRPSSSAVSWAAVIVAAAVVLVMAPALAAPASPEIDVSVQQVEPGDAVAVSGTGFLLPEPTVCEIRWNGPPAPGTQCYIDGGVFGRLVVDASVQPDDYTVRVCVPGCDHPWAGEETAPLTIEAKPSTSDTDPPVEVQLSGSVLSASRSTALVVPAVAFLPSGLVLEPAETVAGKVVGVSAETLPVDFTGAPDCQLTWDGIPAGSCSADRTGSLTGRLVVPDDATGGDHEVAACRPVCSDAVGGEDVSEVLVTAVEPSDEATDEVTTTAEPPVTATADPPATVTTEPPVTATAEPSAPVTATAEPPPPATAPPPSSLSAPPTSVPPDIGATGSAVQPLGPALPVVVLVVVVALLLAAAVSATQAHQLGLTRATPGLRARLDGYPEVQVDELAAVARAPALRLRRQQDMKPTILAEVHDDHPT